MKFPYHPKGVCSNHIVKVQVWRKILVAISCNYINSNTTVGICQAHFYGFTLTFSSDQNVCYFILLSFKILHFFKWPSLWIWCYRVLTLEHELTDTQKRSGQDFSMTMAVTAPPYGHYVILKGVRSVALFCEWLQPLTSKEWLTSVMHLILKG